MKRRIYSSTARLGVALVAHTVAQIGWIWREQPIDDFGIDGQIEIVGLDKKPTGKLIAVQIKTGKSYFKNARGHIIPLYVDGDHRNYWVSHDLPVIVILHDSEKEITIWQWARNDTLTKTSKGWRLCIPHKKIFDADAMDDLAQLSPMPGEFGRRQRFALDLQLMRELAGKEIFVAFEMWVNKTLSMRGIEFRIEDPGKEIPDYDFPWMIPTSDIASVLWHYFPWLEVIDSVDVEECGGGEVEIHVVPAQLSKAALGFIEFEDYLSNDMGPNVLPGSGEYNACWDKNHEPDD